MMRTTHRKSTIAAAVSAGLLGLMFDAPAVAQTSITNASGSTTVNATNSGSGAVSATGTTAVNAATVSGSGSAISGTGTPVQDQSSSSSGTTAPTATTTNATGTTTVGATNSGSGNVNTSGSTTVNAATVSGSGSAVSGTTSPTSTAAPAGTSTTAPTSGQTAGGASAPSATSSSTSTANASATNTNNFYITGGTVSTTPPASETMYGDIIINGDNNIIGNNNNTITGDNNAIGAATTTNGTTGGTAATGATGSTQTSASALSDSNASSLRTGLRTGTAVTLTGSGETVTFTPPTGHMGNGEVDRAITLAKRDLASEGVTNPTPKQLEAALMGGTVVNAQGETRTMDGVLQLRSQGMGWGNVAQTIGVHPAQSEQGAANSRRGGSIASVGAAAGSASQALSRDDGRNQITQGSQAVAVSSIDSANALERDGDNARKQAGLDPRPAAGGDTASLNGRGHSRNDNRGSDRGLSVQAKDRNDAGSVALSARERGIDRSNAPTGTGDVGVDGGTGHGKGIGNKKSGK